MDCNNIINSTRIFKKLKEITDSNESLFLKCYTAVIDASTGDKFDSKFDDFCMKRAGRKLDFKYDPHPEQAAVLIRDYYNYNMRDINTTSKIQNDSTFVGRFGYSSINARQFGVRLVANAVCSAYYIDKVKFGEEVKEKKEHYSKVVKDIFTRHLRDALISATGKTAEELNPLFKNPNKTDLKTLVDSTNSISVKNIFAIYQEMIANPTAYFNEVFNDSRISKFRLKEDTKAEENNFDNIEAQIDGTETANTDDGTVDTSTDKSIEEYKSHMGELASFMNHLDDDVKAYFNSLYKRQDVTNEKGEYAVDTNNDFGIADVMSAEQCCAVLHSYGDYTNLETFIASIKSISEDLKGFRAFDGVAKDLESNLDFAYKLYTIFGKFVMSKIETVSDNGKIAPRTSNRTADKTTSLRFEYLNSVKVTATKLDDENSRDQLKQLREEIKDYLNFINRNPNAATTNKEILNDFHDSIINQLTKQLKRYYPTIDEYAIANYVKNNNKTDASHIPANIQKLVKILDSTISAAYKTQANYSAKQARISAAFANNKKLDELKNDDPTAKIDKSKYIDLTTLFNEEYVDNSTSAAAFELADTLAKYSVIKVELNSTNVHGNRSSDVINNSMITNLLNTLRDQKSLENYGKYKGQSRQYDFSNIMIEHVEYLRYKDGSKAGEIVYDAKTGKPIVDKIINFGLFTQDPNTLELTPTEYAPRLLRARLFSGATDAITNKDVLYSEMSKGDYFATAFVNYFNAGAELENKDDKIQFANYFMRIPSDAPKNFVITAPRYGIAESSLGKNDGLFIFENKKEATSAIDAKINGLKKLTEEEKDNLLTLANSVTRSIDQTIKDITNANTGRIYVKSSQIEEKTYKTGDIVTITAEYEESKDNTFSYVLKGTVTVDNGNIYITNTTFEGIADFNNGKYAIPYQLQNSLKVAIREQMIKNGELKRTINTEHPIFRQLKNQFVQELTDAATAIDKFFETTDGIVALDNNGNPIFKPGFDNSKECARKLYAIYHVAKGKTILENDSKDTTTKKQKLTGAVFKSNRFQITEEDSEGNVTSRNYGQEIIDEAFDFLYGGAKAKHIATVRHDNGISVVLTSAQEESINKHISEYITDYIAQGLQRAEEYKDLLPEELYTNDNIADFVLNHRLMFSNFDDLYEGDTKFYKDTQTFLKRAKEAQGSGVPYGIVNYRSTLLDAKQEVASRLNSTEFLRKTANGSEKVEIKQYNQFTGVTIKNTIRTGETIGVFKRNTKGDIIGFEKKGTLTNHFIDVLKNSGFTEKAAEAKALEMMKGYADTTVNDAQSYITFEEWVRRISARGQLNKYKKLIDAILDETKEVGAKELELFAQVQKNFYYDQYYDATLGVVVPRQIKNSEFVLIPRFIKGTQLEQVYDLMKKHDIDQLNTEETSKAGKANVLTIWDNDGNITEESLKHFDNNVNSAKQSYSYNNLYTQQETPQHMNAENKAGIQIMKKILDNINENSALKPIKDHFFALYCANIHSSFTDLMDRLGVELTEDGNLHLNEENNINSIDVKELCAMFKEEACRLGLDSNMLDYFTLIDDLGEGTTGWSLLHTLMPMYMSNVSTKAESIAQSLFNSNITRQKLPGFHAAQITNVGFTPISGTIQNHSYSKQLKYHPAIYKHNNTNRTISEEQWHNLESDDERAEYTQTTASYVEIMVPKSAFNLQYKNADGSKKSDDDLLKELQKAKLDEIIGYRIPTEGKQSICIMKVVGFLDDTQGSTIIVPDDWVAQTGSDFDIDSVYTITHNSYIDSKGIARRVEYKNEASVEDWYRYIDKALDRKKNRIKKEDSTDDDAKKAAKKAAKEEKRELIKRQLSVKKAARAEVENEAWSNLPKALQDEIKNYHAAHKKGKETQTKEEYLSQINSELRIIQTYLSKNKVNDKEDIAIARYKDINTIIKNEIEHPEKHKIELSEEDEAKLKEVYGAERAKFYKDYFNAKREEQRLDYENQADEKDLMSFEEFQEAWKANPVVYNSREARNNEIVDCMIKILSSTESLEENLSRSNFEKITDAVKHSMNENVKKRRNFRSPYNVFDQVEYQEDVMSGAKLKAASVVRDTFCSICNTAKTEINGSHVVRISYRASDGYTEENLKAAYGDAVKPLTGSVKGWVVEHDRIGWSNNNKNVAGMIITAYSSQTTAHILDAVKEGAVPNVNDLTFPVYKLFPDLGSDYETAVSFIMQPGITEIVKAYNNSKSIYSRTNGDPIFSAIKTIANKILAHDNKPLLENKDNLDSIIKKLKVYSKDIKELFDCIHAFDLSMDISSIGTLVLNSGRLKDRLNNKGKFANNEQAKNLFDLGIVLQYSKLTKLAEEIGAHARVCNPDKFGAKQSIFETNKVFGNIGDILEREKPILTANGLPLLNAIYPGISKNVDEFIKAPLGKSVYPPLYYFLKYATATSIKVNRTLFETQNPNFVNALMSIEKLFSGKNKLDEKTYKLLQNYVLNEIYNESRVIANKVRWNTNTKSIEVEIDSNTDEERARIFGYGKAQSIKVFVKDEEASTDSEVKEKLVDFEIKDRDNITEEELNQFATLSPAQKVFWIQEHYEDSGVFKYIKPQLYHTATTRSNKAGAQTITFVENNDNIETVFEEFKKCYYNEDPIIALATIDLIKYSFTVEGYRMRKNAINRIIPNEVLYKNSETGGTNIIYDIEGGIHKIVPETNSDGSFDINSILNNFIRSHSTLTQIDSYFVKKNSNRAFELPVGSNGIIHLDVNSPYAERYGFGANDKQLKTFITNNYVKLKFGKDIRLYKIEQTVLGSIFAYPVNTLEENEHTEWSVNTLNNKWLSETYYKTILKNYNDKLMTDRDAKLSDIIKEAGTNISEYRYKNKYKLQLTNEAKEYNLNKPSTNEEGSFEDIRKDITDHFKDNPGTACYIRTNALSLYHNQGQSSIQTINGVKYAITRLNSFKREKLDKLNSELLQVVASAFSNTALKSVSNIYQVVKVVEDISSAEEEESQDDEVTEPDDDVLDVPMHSSITEHQSTIINFGVKSVETIWDQTVNKNDRLAAKALDAFRLKNINSSESSVNINLKDIIANVAPYVVNTASRLQNDIKYFDQIDDEYVSIDDPRVINLVRNNKPLRIKLLQTMLEAKALVDNFSLITKINVDSENIDIRENLKRIESAIKALMDSKELNGAETNFANNYLTKLSDNPNLRDELHGILDGYHSATAFDAWINDLQETSNPLIQIITKDVMGDIRASEMKAKLAVSAYKKRLAELKKEAADKGLSINWEHIIDKNGKFIQDYNDDFIKDMEALRSKMQEAEINNVDGKASIEYLKAKLEYDKWKLNHVNQALRDDYYQRKIEIEENMIENFPTIYSEYIKLTERRKELWGYSAKGVLDPIYQDELDNINKRVNILTSPLYYDPSTGMWTDKKMPDEYGSLFTGKEAVLMGSTSAKAIDDYIKNMKELRDQYYKKDAKFGFEEELDKNLDIITNYEAQRMPTAELEKHPDYVEAREWIKNNARFVVKDEIKTLLNEAYAIIRESARINGKNVKHSSRLLSAIAKTKEIYDGNGNIDATQLTEKELEQIKEEQLIEYNVHNNPAHSDQILISNAPTDDTIFKQSFYSGMVISGTKNSEYLKKVNEINQLLVKYYEPLTKTVCTSEMPVDELNTLLSLYNELDDIKKYTTPTNRKSVMKYIEENADYVYDEEKYEQEKAKAALKGNRYLTAWLRVNGAPHEQPDGTIVWGPNSRLYGHLVPKGYKPDGTGNNDLVDDKLTEALRTIRKYTRSELTTYYFDKWKEMKAKGDAEFNKWYEANHVYNPYDHKMEPLKCWTKMSIKEVDDHGNLIDSGTWVPSFSQLNTAPKDGLDTNGKPDGSEDMTNKNFKKGSTASNYKEKPDFAHPELISKSYIDGKSYDNSDAMNDGERAIKNYLQELAYSLATVNSAKAYLDKGYAPSRAKSGVHDSKYWMKEFAKMLGYVESNAGYEAFDRVDYATETIPAMPMTSLLRSKEMSTIEKPKQPNIADYETTPEGRAKYAEDMRKYEDEYKAYQKALQESHSQTIDTNWESVFEDYILKASHFNAIQENKYLLYYGKQMIDKLETYQKPIGRKGFKRDKHGYVKEIDSDLQGQYENWLRRILFDQWKEPNGNFTKVGNMLQSFTSAKFMMFNVAGGIGNVTVGETQILREAIAKEYFNKSDWAKASWMWTSNIHSFIKDLYSDESSSVASAIVKFMNVVDFDEHTGVVHVADAEEYLKRARDIAFSTLSIGEHFMQNSAMFAMMYSHRIYRNNDKELNGKLSYVYKNEDEVVRDAHQQALTEILDDKQLDNWNSFRKHSLSSPDGIKDYAWFKKDLTTEFANIYLSIDQRKEFIKKRAELEDKARKEFNDDAAHPTIISQMTLKDGKLAFKDGSVLANMDDEAYNFLGRFKGRVISVNKKIHGVYDRLGAAQLEKKWYGGLIMQYHKHIYPGIMKRYRSEGYFNEERGTAERGSTNDLLAFLAMPLHKKDFIKRLKASNDMTEDEINLVNQTQNMFKEYIDFFILNGVTNWNILPPRQRHNIKRMMGDALGILGGICIAIALRCLSDDDDEKHGFAYNLFMYEADKLCSESAMYNPWGLFSEGKKLWSSPVAAQTAISDGIHAMNLISQWIIQGEDFDPYYSTGLYTDENKLWVMLRRNIPIYHSVSMLERLGHNNRYYKLGENMLSIIDTKQIADWIKGK